LGVGLRRFLALQPLLEPGLHLRPLLLGLAKTLVEFLPPLALLVQRSPGDNALLLDRVLFGLLGLFRLRLCGCRIDRGIDLVFRPGLDDLIFVHACPCGMAPNNACAALMRVSADIFWTLARFSAVSD